MPHRYFTRELAEGRAALTGSDAHHLADVMRARIGEEVVLCGPDGLEYLGTVTAIEPGRVEFSVTDGTTSKAAPDCAVTLFAGSPKAGTLEEVMELCKLDDRLLPCIDFGHLNARTLGSIRGAEDYEHILLTMKNEIGEQRMKCFHSHFSQIEYTENGGEKRHLTFADTTYGPYFAPLAEVLVKYDSQPTIICESAGTQAEDAATMRDLYNQAAERKNQT